MEYYYKIPQNEFLHMKYRTINVKTTVFFFFFLPTTIN